MPSGEVERWATENDPLDRYARVLLDREKVEPRDVEAIDARVTAEVDEAADLASRSVPAAGVDALTGVFAEPRILAAHWYR